MIEKKKSYVNVDSPCLLIDIGRQVFMKILIIFGRKEFEEKSAPSKIFGTMITNKSSEV